MSDQPTTAEVRDLIKTRDGAWLLIAVGTAGSTWSYATTSGYRDMSTFGLIGSVILGALVALGIAGLLATRVKG